MGIYINKALKEAKEYIKEIWRRKVRLVLAVITAIVLFALSSHYLFDGINKRFCLYTILSLLTGALLVCPRPKRWYLALTFVIIYLARVPQKMFERIELIVHDMTELLGGARFVNILIILLVYAVLLILFQRLRFAFAGGAVLLLILSVINYYCTLFRGSGLTFLDLTAARTAASILKSYQLEMSGELWYTILYFCFFIAFGLWCDLPFKGRRYHVTVTAVPLAFCIFFYGFWNVSDYLDRHGLRGSFYNMWQTLDGFLLGFCNGMDGLSMKKPRGYSVDRLLEIVEDAGADYQPADTPKCNPSIILIMNEAWSDLRVLGNLETTEDFMPFTDSLGESWAKGDLYVEIQGGLTPNSEFEVLTGDALALLSPAAIPYQMQVNHDMYSLARVLKEQGYQTLAMHPSGPASWNREKIYEYFGFDDFIDIHDFQTEFSHVGFYPSDECNFNEIIWWFEHKEEGKPLFLFDVTIQNHGDYGGQVDISIGIEKLGNTPAAEAGDLYSAATYLSLMKITDDAFADLISYFETVEEPVIVCMYGDHQPKLQDHFYDAVFSGSDLTEEQQSALQYITPYVIWANYDIDMPDYGNMSANYLGAAVLECAGAELPPYYQYLLWMQKQFPEISFRTIDGLENQEAVRNYRMLQYNQLIEKNSLQQLFSVLP